MKTEGTNASVASVGSAGQHRIVVSLLVILKKDRAGLQNLLQSVRMQRYQEYEVILTGSRRMCDWLAEQGLISAEEDRIRTLETEECGICAQMNRAMQHARGRFIMFLSAGGSLEEKALHRMVPRIRGADAELMTGQIARFVSYARNPKDMLFLEEMGELKKTDCYHPGWNRFTSVNGFLFRLAFLQEYGIEFRAESACPERLFLLQCLFHTSHDIPVASYLAYQETDNSLPEACTESNLTGDRLEQNWKEFQESLALIDRRIESDEEQLLTECEKGSLPWLEEYYRHISFRSDFVRSYVQDQLLGYFYRHLWLGTEQLYDLICGRLAICRSEMLPADWKQMVADNKDLRLGREQLMSPQAIIEEPLISVLASDRIPKERRGSMLLAMYQQTAPAFELLIDEAIDADVPDEVRRMPNVRFVPHAGDWVQFRKQSLPEMKGVYAFFMDEDLIPAGDILHRMVQEIKGKAFISAAITRQRGDGFENVQPNDTAFVNELVVVKLRSRFNRLDWMWGNKLFNIKVLKSRKVLFNAGPYKDMNRLYNNSSLVKIPDHGFLTGMSDHEVRKHAGFPGRLGYRLMLAGERRRLKRNERESVRIVTKQQQFKKILQKWMRQGYKFATLKVAYPLCYRMHRRKPVEENKILFVIPRHADLTNSMTHLYDVLQASGKYEIHVHGLNEMRLRYRQQFKVNLKFIKDMATAKCVFLDDYIPCLGGFDKRNETKVVQLWHGCGAFKKFGYSTAEKIFGADARQQKRFRNYANHDIVTVSSPEVVWAYEEAMLMEGEGIVQPLGVSRTDVFFDPAYIEAARQRVADRVPVAKEKKIILYAPTFRGSVAKASAPNRLDYRSLYEALGDDYIILVKHHPFVKKLPFIAADFRDTFVFDVTRDLEIEDLICVADVCISDYSSLVFEYSLFERPIIMFAYDLEDYFDWRGFYYDYYDMAPGPVVGTTQQIIDYITNLDEQFDREQMRAFKEKFMSSCDGNATKRILSYAGLAPEQGI